MTPERLDFIKRVGNPDVMDALHDLELLEAEVERLRGALENIVNHGHELSCSYWQTPEEKFFAKRCDCQDDKIAQAALEEPPP